MRIGRYLMRVGRDPMRKNREFSACERLPGATDCFSASMTPPSAPSRPSESAPSVSLKRLCTALGKPVRWQLLAELATGEPLRVAQFAKAVGLGPDTTSKHLITLRTAGIAEFAENRLYCLHDRFMPDPDKWEIDFGHCVVRLPQPKVGKRKSR
jgi:hypothetical protein